MNQDKLEVVKQEIERVNIGILKISKLKRTWMGEFDSGDQYIYYSEQESLRRIGIAMIVNKTVWNAVLACNLNYDIMIAAHFQAKPLTSTVIQVYALDSNAKEAEVEWFSEDVQGLLELTSKKMSFSLYWTRMQKCEVEIPGLTGKFGVKSTKWSKAKSNRVLLREHTGHSKHPLPIIQVKSLHMDITKCPWKTLHMAIPKSDWWYSLQPKVEKLSTVSKNKNGTWLWLRSWTPCCQIHT